MGAPLVQAFQPTRKVFGSGDLFLNSIHVGEIKNVVFKLTEEEVDSESGRPLLTTDIGTTRQKCEMTAQSAELSSRSVRQALSGYGTATGAVLHEVEGVAVTLVGVVDSSLGHTSICKEDGTAATDADITVVGLDGTVYVDADYDMTPATGLIKRTALSSIPDGATVVVQFAWFQATAETTHFGGGQSCGANLYVPLRFIYKFTNCDQLEINLHKVKPAGGLTANFESENFTTRDLLFRAVADLTKPAKFRYGYITMHAVS